MPYQVFSGLFLRVTDRQDVSVAYCPRKDLCLILICISLFASLFLCVVFNLILFFSFWARFACFCVDCFVFLLKLNKNSTEFGSSRLLAC